MRRQAGYGLFVNHGGIISGLAWPRPISEEIRKFCLEILETIETVEAIHLRLRVVK
jgi:hypothetical protein